MPPSGRRTLDKRVGPDDGIVRFQTRPGRFVFAERDNPDGWIATDLAVDPEP